MPTSLESNKKNHSRRKLTGVLIAILILVIGAIWAIGNKEQMRDIHTNPAGKSILQHDLDVLWEWNDTVYAGGSSEAEWSLRWDVRGSGASLEQLSKTLFNDGKDNDMGRIIANGADQLNKELPQYGGMLSIHRIPSSQQSVVMLLFQSRGSTEKLKLLALIAMIEDNLKGGDTSFNGGITVRGYSVYNNAAERVASLADAQIVDVYEDDGTISETLNTERLYGAIQAGNGKKANLQIAVHQETDNGKVSLIIATPLITGDYTVSNE
ncbi:MAG: YwmB family TATA-box binding protein [Candidatus Pristimantibacillus sp.]